MQISAVMSDTTNGTQTCKLLQSELTRTDLGYVRGARVFPKKINWEPPQNYRRQKGDMKQFPHWGSIIIRRRGTKALRPGFVRALVALSSSGTNIRSKTYQIIIRMHLLVSAHINVSLFTRSYFAAFRLILLS